MKQLVNIDALSVTKVSAAPHPLSKWEMLMAFKWLLIIQTSFLALIFGGIAVLFVQSPDGPLPKGDDVMSQTILTLAASHWLLPTLCVVAIVGITALNIYWTTNQRIATVDEVERANRELAQKYK